MELGNYKENSKYCFVTPWNFKRNRNGLINSELWENKLKEVHQRIIVFGWGSDWSIVLRKDSRWTSLVLNTSLLILFDLHLSQVGWRYLRDLPVWGEWTQWSLSSNWGSGRTKTWSVCHRYWYQTYRKVFRAIFLLLRVSISHRMMIGVKRKYRLMLALLFEII